MAVTFTVLIDWDQDGTWTDETTYLRRLSTWAGFEQPRDDVAGIGRCEILFENMTQRFSPDNELGPLYGYLLPRREVRVQASDGVDTWTLWRGFIDAIAPQTGLLYGFCRVTCVDGVALLEQQRVGVAHEDSKAVDEAVSAVVAAAYSPPASSYADNGDQLEHYGRSWLPEETSCRAALGEICAAVYGRFYVARDGTASYLTRQDRHNLVGVAALNVGQEYLEKVKLVRASRLEAYWPLWGDAYDVSGNGLDGTPTNVTWGVSSLGDGRTAAYLDGSAYINMYSAGLSAAMDSEGTVMLWIQCANGWSDGTYRTLLHLLDSGGSYVKVRKNTTGNLTVTYKGSAEVSVNTGTPSTDWACVVLTWSSIDDAVKVYLNGDQVGGTQTGAGDWSGLGLDLLSAVLGQRLIGGLNLEPHLGSLAHVAIWSAALDTDEVAVLNMPSPAEFPTQLEVNRSISQVINRVQVTVYPPETVGMVQVLWQAQTVLRLGIGDTRIVYALFRDDNGERVGALDVVTPVATTDFEVNTARDGSGVNYTSHAGFSIATETEATRMKVTLVNSSTHVLYMTRLQVRGKPIRVYDPITVEAEDAASQAAYEVRARGYDLVMQVDPEFGNTLSQYLVKRYAQPVTCAERLVLEDRETLGGVNVFGVELLDQVVLSDRQTGIDGVKHQVRALSYELDRSNYRVEMALERGDDVAYWQLGRVGYGELGETTVLGM